MTLLGLQFSEKSQVVLTSSSGSMQVGLPARWFMEVYDARRSGPACADLVFFRFQVVGQDLIGLNG